MVNRLHKQSSSKKNNGSSTLCSSRSCSFRLPKGKELYPLKYFRFLGGKMVEAIQVVSGKRGSPRVSSSSERVIKHGVAPMDSHRAEAIDDCIEFINSSSSFPRSKSVSH
ncbi:hypothetical protein Leryth_014416 [Lithospermum erythrorhizon]|nr:hypothetical protein Leryth_014416 [Lithospermum erythrorhizon]